MKVIDILNKIANKEELPKKISINDYVLYDEYTIWTLEDGCYSRDITDEEDEEERQFLFEYLTTNMLNDEVEIIEDIPEEDNKIEKIKNYKIKRTMGLDCKIQEEKIPKNYSLEENEIVDKINEIIDKLNGE